jgi:hypothetical protein
MKVAKHKSAATPTADDWELERYEREIVFQADMMDIAWRELQDAVISEDSLRTWHAIQSILTAGACISRILWPSGKGPRRDKDYNQAYRETQAELRTRLNVEKSNPLNDRTVRNHFEHLDERLADWANQRIPAFGDLDIVPAGQPWAKITAVTRGDGSWVEVPQFRRFDPSTWKVSFHEDEIDLRRVVDAARQLRNRIPGQHQATGWPPGFFDRTFGSFRDDPIEPPVQLPLEAREPLN